MTIDELYMFCVKNNFTKFDGNESNKELRVEMPGYFEKDSDDSDRMTDGLTPFISKAFHDHVNLNKSEIKPKTFKDNVPSSNLRPILANIVVDQETGELDFGSHDYHIEKYIVVDENGNEIEKEKTVYDEQPIGVIDGSKTSIEYDKEAKVNRAILHGFLYNEYCQDAIDILERRGTVDCSVELAIRAMSYDSKSKVLVLDDFYVSGLTLLSANTKPGMAGSNLKIEDFSIDKNSIEYSKNDKLIELLESLNEKLSKFNMEQTPAQTKMEKGGLELPVNKLDELLSKYNKTLEDLTFDYADLTDEELEAKFTEVFENVEPESAPGMPENEPVIPEKYSVMLSDGSIKEFTLSLDEITMSLYTLVNEMYGEADNAYYSVTVYEDNTLVMSDYWNGKFYRQSFNRDGDNFSLVGDRVAVHSIWVTDEEEVSLNEMRSNYASLVAYKEAAEFAKLHAQREEILANDKYSVLAENDSFKSLVENMDNYSLVDLEKEAKVIFADYVASVGHYSYEPSPKHPKNISVGNNSFESHSDNQGPYGGLVTI